MFKDRVIERSSITTSSQRRGKSEDEILAATGTEFPATDDIKLKYLHVEGSSTKSSPSRPKPAVSPLTLATPSLMTTYPASLDTYSTRLPQPVSFIEMPSENSPFLDLQNQRDFPVLNVQQSSNYARANDEHEELSDDIKRLRLSMQHADLFESSAVFTTWSFLADLESYTNVIDQMLKPDVSSGSAISQLNVIRMLSGFPQASSQRGTIQGLGDRWEDPNDPMKDANGQQKVVDVSQRFLVRVLGGCMLHNQGSVKGAAILFHQAHDLFEAIIRDSHPKCLIVLNVMLSVLKAHGRNQLAGDFLVSVISVLHLLYNPVAATVKFMIQAVTRELRNFEADMENLQAIYETTAVPRDVTKTRYVIESSEPPSLTRAVHSWPALSLATCIGRGNLWVSKTFTENS